MKRKAVSFGTIALVACAGMTPVAALAQPTEPNATGEVCPSVQMIAINDVNDSALGQSGAGFLGSVAAPVLASANGKDTTDAELDGGFTAPSTTSTAAAPAQTNNWKPNVWEDTPAASAAQPTHSVTTDWKPDMWGTPPTSASGEELKDKQATQESARQPEKSEPTPTEAATTNAAEKKAPNVGRTIIEVASTDDTRAYIPGVTGPESIPAYEESINTAAADTEAVLGNINSTCPNTKVILLGVGQGAHAASIISKRIGAGEVFPAEKVLGVSLFADPSREEGQPVVANGASAPAGAKQDWNVAPAPGAGVATVRGDSETLQGSDFGAVADRTVSWCMEGDTTCALPDETPLRTLVAKTSEGTEGKAPEQVLQHVTDVLGPAVLLGSVETLASDVEFGPGGFTFNRASSPDGTLIGRIASESDRQVPQDEMEQRMLAAGMQIGGMALAAGATVVKEVLRPENVAQIAVAAAASPAAGVGAALLIAGGATMDLVSEQTVTTGALRLADEAQAFGVDDQGLAEAAVQAAVGSEVSKSTGAYSKQVTTSTGASASEATKDWLLDVVGEELERPLDGVSRPTPAAYDSAATSAAWEDM